jgi:aminopeptidase YwaD
VGLAYSDDIPDEGLGGKIALIQRGTIPFEEKVTRVADAGAIAAIIYNGTDGMFRGALATLSTIPAVSMSKKDGEALLALLAQGDLSASVAVENRVMLSRNVVAEMKGTIDDGRSVVVGGHYDTVADVPGANDNGSGTATTMTVARAIAGNPYPFTVRFMLFGSEEEGLLGSFDYVRGLTESQRADIIAMINYDALATGDELKVLGDGELAATVMLAGDAMDYTILRQYTLGNASSDHAVFLEAGIPALFFLAEDISRIHTPEDRLEFIRPELMGASAFFGIALLGSLVDG